MKIILSCLHNLKGKSDYFHLFLMLFSVLATIFNRAKQPPDVINDSLTASDSPTSSVTAVGFRFVCVLSIFAVF